MVRLAIRVTALAALGVLSGCDSGPSDDAADAGWRPPPVDASFDYQIGGDYPLPNGVTVVSRDWFAGDPAGGDVYSICYVNAFQTQPDDSDVDRPDERGNWPGRLVLTALGDDPNWEGEFPIDLSTAEQRRQAATWIEPIVETCRDDGFDAVEFDNLDVWTRFDGGAGGGLPFGEDEVVEYAELITDHAHQLGLAVGQKNTPNLSADVARDVIGFDFAVVEECGRFVECEDYRDVFGDNMVVVEYDDAGFRRACDDVGDAVSVVRRDIAVSRPGSGTYVFDTC